MEAKHTPGPWAVEVDTRQDGQPGYAIRQGDDGYGAVIAETRPDEPSTNTLANARIIAAAPQLLAALRDMTSWADSLGEVAKNCGAIDRSVMLNSAIASARAAIARAEA